TVERNLTMGTKYKGYGSVRVSVERKLAPRDKQRVAQGRRRRRQERPQQEAGGCGRGAPAGRDRVHAPGRCDRSCPPCSPNVEQGGEVRDVPDRSQDRPLKLALTSCTRPTGRVCVW